MRSHTASFHLRVDDAFGRFDLTTIEEYGLFLTAQAIALGVAEALAPPARRRYPLLVKDLEDLGLPLPPAAFDGVDVLDAPGRRGVSYVLEGSRLGGAMLRRQVPESFPARFLSARHGPGEWRAFLAGLDDWGETQPEPSLVAALCGAERCFALFEEAASSVAGKAAANPDGRSSERRGRPSS